MTNTNKGITRFEMYWTADKGAALQALADYGYEPVEGEDRPTFTLYGDGYDIKCREVENEDGMSTFVFIVNNITTGPNHLRLAIWGLIMSLADEITP